MSWFSSVWLGVCGSTCRFWACAIILGMIVSLVAMSELAPATASELDSATTATSQLASWSASAVVTPRPGYCSSRGGCSPRTATPGHVYLVQHAECHARSTTDSLSSKLVACRVFSCCRLRDELRRRWPWLVPWLLLLRWLRLRPLARLFARSVLRRVLVSLGNELQLAADSCRE